MFSSEDLCVQASGISHHFENEWAFVLQRYI